MEGSESSSCSNGAGRTTTKRVSNAGKGRRKIEIKRIDNKQRSRVTFAKRRQGLFKKASELHTLCGADTAVVAISSCGKPFSFGQPSPAAVIRRYLLGRILSFGEHHLLGSWWSLMDGFDNEMEAMGVDELQRELADLEELQRTVLARADELAHAASTSTDGNAPGGSGMMVEEDGVQGMGGGIYEMDDYDTFFEGLEPLDDHFECDGLKKMQEEAFDDDFFEGLDDSDAIFEGLEPLDDHFECDGRKKMQEEAFDDDFFEGLDDMGGYTHFL